MRRGRVLIFVLLIVVVGVVVGVFALQQVMGPKTPTQSALVEVYVAGQNIPQGGEITEAVLSTISIPQDKVIAGEFTREELAQLTTNKIARYPLDQNVIITDSMVVDKSVGVSIAGPQWAALVPPGMTAISIPSTRLSLASFGVADGAHVNINACFLFVDLDPSFQSALPNVAGKLLGPGSLPDQLPVLSLSGMAVAEGGPQGRLELDPSVQQPFYIIPSEAPRPRPVCQLLLQDVVVLRVGNFPLGVTALTQPSTQAQQQQAQTTPVSPDVVTLIVSPQDSIMLSYLTYTNAQLQLVLRNPTDQSRQATIGATLQFLLSQYNIPVPAKLPYSTQPRIDVLVAPTLPNDVPVTPK